ncbi:hypothetical protein BJI69_04610 [Luteibacter rhizovicinus DSM 16549]|uniref:Uncharacterized protein n=1 Tax=Luteibacter rhizovicinus DSM 16549 TaxID=1440763 RepID=A0A0G9H3K3_9GAMM|nr:hypothetical protein [Luteibacter rhizovicinus]APG03261.1 hypothetical protein BJI69_04610 [Luteibacter rhizovicinus DSM 16549]KLD64430.1 hypothetical protein Y883_18070 [Luteibacter rhizovicinus DSM 16549]KLD69178.1 hypothetical protein Y886_43215 [Xanthomonas hyacinthi DSM 19077]
MPLPWFLELLSLPPHADERAVRRAYATRVKLIDPATDPAAFARLREAYEAARAWAADEEHGLDHDAAAAPPPVLTEPVPSVDTPSADSTAQPYAAINPQEQAVRLVDRLTTRIASGEAADIRDELDACTAELRLQYIDAPGIFEDVFIDRLARGLFDKRPYVFTLAMEHFHWQEIGHLAALGPKGMWIEAVESQRMAWNSLPPLLRANRLSLIAAADAAKGNLSTALVRRWFEVRDDFHRFPAYLGLYLTMPQQHAWATSYDALPATERQALEAPAKTPRWRWPTRESIRRAWGFFFIAFVGGLIYLLESAATIPRSTPPTPTPVPAAVHNAETSDLEVTLSEPSGSAEQDKGWIVVTLTNRGRVTLYLRKMLTPPMTPGEHLARPLFTVHDFRGHPAAFARGVEPIDPDDARDAATFYRRLEPGQSISNRVDLGSDYDLDPRFNYWVGYRQPVARTYRVDADGTIHDDDVYVDSNRLMVRAVAPHADRALPPR